MSRTDSKSQNVVEHSNIRAARSLARNGYAIFPADPATKRPMPGVKWRDVATSDLAQIESWWRKWPDAMPALPTGSANGVSVVDLDMHGDRDGVTAYRDRGFDPEAASLIVKTAGGGLHLYFEHQAGVRNSTDPAGIDVRGDGGYVIAPGAIGKAGEYRVQKDDVEFAQYLVREIGVAAVPGSSFYRNAEFGRTKLRFCFCKQEETLREADRRLAKLGVQAIG